jgi:hypothetical protein
VGCVKMAPLLVYCIACPCVMKPSLDCREWGGGGGGVGWHKEPVGLPHLTVFTFFSSTFFCGWRTVEAGL